VTSMEVLPLVSKHAVVPPESPETHLHSYRTLFSLFWVTFYLVPDLDLCFDLSLAKSLPGDSPHSNPSPPYATPVSSFACSKNPFLRCGFNGSLLDVLLGTRVWTENSRSSSIVLSFLSLTPSGMPTAFIRVFLSARSSPSSRSRHLAFFFSIVLVW